MFSYGETYQPMLKVWSYSPPEFCKYCSKKTADQSYIIIINIYFSFTKYFQIDLVLETLQNIYYIST